MKSLIITGQWLDTLPLPHARPYMLNYVIKLAREKDWEVISSRTQKRSQ